MSLLLMAFLVFGLGLYLVATSVPFGAGRPPLQERLRRFDVDVLMRQRPATSAQGRRLLPWAPADALLRPLLEDLAAALRRLMAADSELDEQLRVLHRGTTPVGFVARQIFVGGVFGVATLVVALAVHLSLAAAVLLTSIAAMLGFVWPQLQLRAAARTRRARISSELPQVAWLMAVARSAGLGLDASVEQVANSSVGPLGEGLQRARAQVGGGVSLVDALEAFAEREGVPELTDLVGRLRATDELGLPLVQALEDLATGVHEKSVNQLLEEGEKGGLKALLPLGLGMLPVSVAITLTPGILVVLHLVH